MKFSPMRKNKFKKEEESVWYSIFENYISPIVIIDKKLSILKINIEAQSLFSNTVLSNNIAELLQEERCHWNTVIANMNSIGKMQTEIGKELFNIIIVRTYVETKEYYIMYFLHIEDTSNNILNFEQDNHLFKTLIQYSFDGIGILNQKGEIIFQSPASERILGFPHGELLHKNAFDYICEDDLEKAYSTFQQSLQAPEVPFHVQIRFKTVSGVDRWVEVTATNYLHQDTVGGVIINYSDIHDKRMVQHENWFMAHHDQLTELPNRRYHDQYLTNLLHNNTNEHPVYILVDLDDFKSYNETIGNDIGDHLLKKVAILLSSEASKNQGFVARIGGDEFALIYPSLGKKQIIEAVKNIMKAFDYPISIHSFEYNVSASIGASVYPSSSSAHDLRKNASLALLMAKKAGKNTYKIYDPESDMDVFRSMELQRDLGRAVIENQFSLVYQPKYSTARVCVGYEALLRWNHPTWGIISPGEFILLAEETKQIIPIGEWVIKRVCEQIQEWREDGRTLLPVSLNVSAVQFLHSDICEVLKEFCTRYRVSPSLVQIEITETVLLHHTDQVAMTFVNLQKMGYKIALDDFGLGYSSLSYLLEYDVDIVKLDKRFARELTDQKAIDIVRHLIQLLKKIDVVVVIEGVETKEQFDFFREMNCDEIQGYYLSKPLPPEKAIELGLSEDTIDAALMMNHTLHGYIKGMLTIKKLHQKPVQTGASPIFIQHAGVRSMDLRCKIRLPLTEHLVIGISLPVAGELLEVNAIINHTVKLHLQEEWYEYKVSYVFHSEEEKRKVIQQINTLQIANRKKELRQVTDVVDECS